MDTGDLSSLISGVTSDPEMMKKLMGMVSTFSQSQETPKDNSEQKNPAQVSGSSVEASNRRRLISALKPYLNEERRDKADKLLGLLSLLELTRSQNTN